MFLEYAQDGNNRFEDSIENLREFIVETHEFARSYKRKPKKFRRNSSGNEPAKKNNILTVPKFERIKRNSEDLYEDYESV